MHREAAQQLTASAASVASAHTAAMTDMEAAFEERLAAESERLAAAQSAAKDRYFEEEERAAHQAQQHRSLRNLHHHCCTKCHQVLSVRASINIFRPDCCPNSSCATEQRL